MNEASSSRNIFWNVTDLGKKFYQRWLFRHISHDFNAHPRLGISGPNGSGKSTLLKILAGQMLPTEGNMTTKLAEKSILADHWYQYIAWAAPYISMYPILTLTETIRLHQSMKPTHLSDPQDIISILGLEKHADKKLQYFSSGMYQRVSVGLAILSHTPVLMLDEPSSNLDKAQSTLIQELLSTYTAQRIVIVASNLDRDLDGFEQIISLRTTS